jgi:carboxymethylenebutenolidase
MLSGRSGVSRYRDFARRLAQVGYYTVLLDGNDFYGDDAFATLSRAIAAAHQSPQAKPGKVAVVGFSLGGGAALAVGTSRPQEIAAVVAHYPVTLSVTDARAFAARFAVPTLVLAGEQDQFLNCCLIQRIRAIEAAARERNADFRLVVYPAGHGFNLPDGSNYRLEFAGDSWARTVEMLRRHHPLP